MVPRPLARVPVAGKSPQSQQPPPPPRFSLHSFVLSLCVCVAVPQARRPGYLSPLESTECSRKLCTLEKTHESPLDSREIKPVHPKRNQP